MAAPDTSTRPTDDVERFCPVHTYLTRPGGACLIVAPEACVVREAHA